jgi:serine protease Do
MNYPAPTPLRAWLAVAVACLPAWLASCKPKAQGDGKPADSVAAMGGLSPSDTTGPASAAAPGPDRYAGFRSVFTDVARKVIPSVVSVSMERSVPAAQNPFEFFFGDPSGNPFGDPSDGGTRQQPRDRKESGLGSGFIVDEKGLILTNNHVVEGAQKLTVQLADEREFEAEVVGTDKPSDIALIRIKHPPDGLAPLRFGDSDKLQIGEWVVAVGAPFGLYESVTTGIISAKGRQNTGISTYGNFLQTDAAINPGNSGGPLVNLDGEVVGINTAIYSQSGGYMGIGFAIPVNLARGIQASLQKNGKVERGWLGISIQSVSRDMAEALGQKVPEGGIVRGALIGDVVPDSPAEKAGLQRGDLVTRIDGAEVKDANDLMNRVALLIPGSKAELTVIRGGKERKITVSVGKRDEGKLSRQEGGASGGSVAALGLAAADLDDAARRQYRIGKRVKEGAVVTQVDQDGPAAGSGIREGDVIVEADRRKVASAADLDAAVAEEGKDGKILLLISRRGDTFFAMVRLR